MQVTWILFFAKFVALTRLRFLFLEQELYPTSRFARRCTFCLVGIRETQELTDFGGGIQTHNGESAIQGALREFQEETLGIARITSESLASEFVVYDDNVLILFLPLNSLSITNGHEFIKEFLLMRKQRIKESRLRELKLGQNPEKEEVDAIEIKDDYQVLHNRVNRNIYGKVRYVLKEGVRNLLTLSG